MTLTRSLLLFGLVALALCVGWWGRGAFQGQNGMATESTQSEGANSRLESPCAGGGQVLYWKAPMDPSYVRTEPGLSPMGMALIPECERVGTTDTRGVVSIDSQTIQNMGVRTMVVGRRDLARIVRAVGRVTYDERRIVHVHTKVQGWVESLLVDFVGQEVRRDQPMLEIYSPELVATQEELLLAARYREVTEKSPFDDVRGGGESLLSTTKRRLALWDVPKRDIERLLNTGDVKRTLTLYAPADGVITRLGVRSGMEVNPNSNLYTISDLSRVWVVANVYEYELPWLAVGQNATVELSYLPNAGLVGEISYIAPFLDPMTRTAEVRLELDNSAGLLKPEMFGNLVIEGTPRTNVLAIPAEAIIRSGTRTIGIVSLGDGRFEPRELVLGLDSGDGWLEVAAGIAEGEEIVVSSQFLLDSESNLREAVRKSLGERESRSPRPATDLE